MIHWPDPALRPWAIGALAFSTAVFAAAGLALAVHVPGRIGTGSAFGAPALALWAATALLLCGLLAWLTRVIARGREAYERRHSSRVLESGDPMACVAMGICATTFLAMAATLADRQLAEGSDLPWLVVGLAIALGCLGGVLALGAGLVAGNAVLRGRSRLVLERLPVRVGETLRARLEVPFPAPRRLAFDAELTLTRRQPGPSADDPPDDEVVWSERHAVVAAEPAARGRAAARLEIPLDLERPCDVGAGGVCYLWTLRVEPHEPLWWNASFELPIEL